MSQARGRGNLTRRFDIIRRWRTASREPSWMPTGSTRLEFNRNRHTKIEPKPSDRDLSVMRFDDASGKPLAIVVNFAAHPTMIPAETLKFSADYVGAMKA